MLAINANPHREEIEDVWYGQVVTVVARWCLIVAGVLLTLWRADDINDVTTPIYLLMGLIALNFFMHGRYLTGMPMRREVVVASCVIDVAVISMVIAAGSWKAEGGIDSPSFIFYYPVLLAFALVFPWRLTLLFSCSVLAVYTALVLADSPVLSIDDSEALAARLVTMASTALLGTVYWRLQRQVRREQANGPSRR